MLIPARSVPEGVAKYSIIDGQQRYTTLSILFAALCEVATANNEERLSEEIRKRFLINEFSEGNDYFKLLPTQSDRKAYQTIIQGTSPNSDDRLSRAFVFFESKLRHAGLPLKKIKDTIEKYLSIVRVLLDDRDDPYLVFESLNAKGKPLSQADLIRNYFLMRIHTNRQEELHAKFWQPMDELLGEGSLTEFIRHYLVMRRGDFVKASDTYFSLRDFVEKGNRDVVGELQTLSRFSGYYAKLIDPRRESNTEIASQIARLNRLEITTAYPFLLACYDDYDNGRLTANMFFEILNIIENFIIRRFVCAIPTNHLNKIFPPLHRQVKDTQKPFVEGVKDILEQRNYPERL